MADINLTELRQTAAKATPGVWKLWGMTVMADQDGTSNVDSAVEVAHTVYRDERGKPRTWDAMHIAAFDPPTALALLDRMEAAEARVARVEALCDAAWFTGEIHRDDIREALAGDDT